MEQPNTDIIVTQTSVQGNDITRLVEQFLAESQLSHSSKNRYKKSLKIYFKWINDFGVKLNEITLVDLLKYKDFLKTKKKTNGELLSDGSIEVYMIGVKVFYNWAESRRLIIQNPARFLKSSKKENKFKRAPLPMDILVLLLAHFKKTCFRNFVIANTLARCGIRVIELVRLNWGDIDYMEGRRVIHVHGKGRLSKDRWVKLKDDAFHPIEKYVSTRKDITADSPIFVSESPINGGGRLISGTISEIICDGLRAVGVDDRRYTAHSLRHFAGSVAISSGASLEQVQVMLRHENSSTTVGYVKMAQEKKRLLEKSAEDYVDDALRGL